jgi:hypothetical protein
MIQKQFADHIEALNDLAEFVRKRNEEQGDPAGLPKDILNAQSDQRRFESGKGKKKYPVKFDRVKRLCQKHAPGRYRFMAVVVLVG